MKKVFLFIVLFLYVPFVFAEIDKSPEDILAEQKYFNALPKCIFTGYLNGVQTKKENDCSELHSLSIVTSKGLLDITAHGTPNICDSGTFMFPYFDKNGNEIQPRIGMMISGVVNTKTDELLLMGNQELRKYENYSECTSDIIPEILNWKEDLIYLNPNFPSSGVQRIISEYLYFHTSRIFYALAGLLLSIGILIGIILNLSYYKFYGKHKK